MSSYPKRLLPSKNSPILTSAELEGREVARWHDPSDLGSIFENDDSVDASLIHYKRFVGFSCNLIPPSTCEDLKINLLDSDLEYGDWTLGTEPPEIKESDFEIIEDREVYKFNFKDIHNERLPYKIEGNNYNLTIDIIHTPKLGNYSHCEFKLVPSHPDSSNYLKNLSSSSPKYHQILITSIRRLLEKFCRRCN